MVERIAEKKRWQLRRWIAEQQRSGLSVRRFCEEQGLRENSFYWWRKRLQRQEPVRFAPVDRGPTRADGGLELVLTGGERLRISAGVDGATQRTVLEALRG